MNASSAANAQGATLGPRWLLLIHQLPPKPDYLRVKVRRRIQRLGAVGLKNTVYALPNTEEAREDFAWLVREIESEGGSAMLCEANFVDGISDEEVEAMLEAQQEESDVVVPRGSGERVEPGRTWVTREGLFVDRIASAWLIRRFIDPKATFKFVPARGYTPNPGELRFDMYQAEYTHEGERCTFQTLLARFDLKEKALQAIGEVVHDIDCKDDMFARPETQGVARLLRGIADSSASDAERLERGGGLFDMLYAGVSGKR